MIREIPVEVLLAAGYAIFLVIVAAVLERLAAHSHRRSERFEVAGFIYHRRLDRWECPTGNHLHRTEVDHDRRVVRYRATAHVCNTCSIKKACTDSDTGREIERHLDSWLQSEVRRFQRGVSLTLLVLAELLLAIEAARYGRPPALFILGSLLVVIGTAAARAFWACRTSSTG